MRVRATTDNFLPARGKSYYMPRPIVHTPRRDYAYQSSPQQPISHILASETTARSKPQLSLHQVLPILAVIVFVLGITVSLTGVKTNARRPGRAPALQLAVAQGSAPPPIPAPTSFGLPRRLKIPKINVDAAVEHMGLTSQGTLNAPKSPSNAGWYDQGPRPGEKGSSVIDGHFGYQNHIPAVFDNLHKLQKGDNLYVEDEQGATIAFVVRELRKYGLNDDASVVFGSNDGRAHLNLITCQGAWDKNQKSYSNRLVVFADKVKE